MNEAKRAPHTERKVRARGSALLAVLLLALAALTLTFGSSAAPIAVTVPYSTVAVADVDLDGDPLTGAWDGAVSAVVPLENGAASPYGTATLLAKHDGTYFYFRLDGKIDVSWTSAAGTHFWLGIEISPASASHHGGGTWDGVFFGLWDGTDYTPQPTYPPLPVDTNGFAKPPSKDASQDIVGKLRYSGTSAPYSFTAEWKKKLNTGDANDIAHAADGTTTYNFFVTTDSDGKGSSGGTIDHSVVTNTNTLKFAPPVVANTPPQADLTTPNGGERWSGNSPHAIRWNMSDAETASTSLKVWLNFSTNSGSSYSPISAAQGLSGLSNPCSYVWTLPTLDTAQARVKVTVVDAQGAAASDFSAADFTIDSTPPTVTAFNPPDGATNVNTATQVRIAFSEPMNTASAEQAFSLRRLDTGAYITGSITWSGNDLIFTPSSALAGGVVYRAQVNSTAKDRSDPGNSLGSVSQASFTTVDLTPPTIAAVSASPSPQEAGGAVNISASVSDNGMVAGVWVEVSGPGGAFLGNSSASYDPASGRYFHAATYTAPGTYGFEIAAQDAAGNWNVVPGSFVIVDTTTPTIQHVPATETLKDTPLRITAQITDFDAVSAARLDYTDVLGARSNVSMALNGTLYEATIPAQGQLGTLTYFLWASDPSGNAVRTPTVTVTVVGSDTTPPSISVVVAAPTPQDANLPVNISATVSDNTVLASVRVVITGPQGQLLGNFSMARLDASDIFYHERAYTGLGRYGFTVWATDGSNNAASSGGTFEIVDRLPPVMGTVQIAPPLTEAGQPVTISAAVTDNVAVLSVSVEIRDAGGGIVFTGALSEASGLYSAVATIRSLGTLTVTVTAQDSAGNVATSEGTLTVVDTQPPLAAAGPSGEVWIGSVVLLNASASSDNSAIVNFTWSFAYNGSDVVLNGPLASFRFDLGGSYNITLRVVDAAGLEATATLVVVVTSDVTPPPAAGNVAIAPAVEGCLRISWDSSTAADLSGYRLYRWNGTLANFELVTELPTGTTSYTDCGLAEDAVYSYWVVAIDSSGNPSAPSPIVSGKTSASLASGTDWTPFVEAAIVVALLFAVIVAVLRAGEKKRGGTPPLPPR